MAYISPFCATIYFILLNFFCYSTILMWISTFWTTIIAVKIYSCSNTSNQINYEVHQRKRNEVRKTKDNPNCRESKLEGPKNGWVHLTTLLRKSLKIPFVISIINIKSPSETYQSSK